MQRVYDKTIEKPCGFLFARWSAGAKAYEYNRPVNRRIIEDPYASYYSGRIGMAMVYKMHTLNPSIRKAIVLRARYMDDYSRQCMQDGYQQVVLLGAGYDSRYLRIKEFRSVRVFELDLDSTQQIKKALTRKLLGRLPGNVTYVPMDFSKDSITEKLSDAGFSNQKRTLFIWEGVTLFLNEDIISETLGRLAETGPDNRIVFDFVPPELVDDETDYMGNRLLLDLCASIKEPLTFGCNPEKMTGILKATGFGKINIISMREANRMYCGTDKIEDSYYFATAEANDEKAKKKALLLN